LKRDRESKRGKEKLGEEEFGPRLPHVEEEATTTTELSEVLSLDLLYCARPIL
jgi:hypothetical protein